MSAETLQVVAVDYQKGLLKRLDDEVKDTDMKGKSIINTMADLASRRDKVLAFNYASQALNNSFFLDMMKPPSAARPRPQGATTQGHEEELSHRPKLVGQIDADFGSLTGLKSAFSAAAMGMMGSGWVWVVSDAQGRLSVSATYGTGTMLFRSRQHQGRENWVLHEPPPPPAPKHTSFSRHLPYNQSRPSLSSSYSSPTNRTGRPQDHPNPYTPSRPSSTSAATEYANSRPSVITGPEAPQLGGMLAPVFTCSIHEHCWLRDHGIWGKEAYLQRYWDVLDWYKVGEFWTQSVGPIKYGG